MEKPSKCVALDVFPLNMWFVPSKLNGRGWHFRFVSMKRYMCLIIWHVYLSANMCLWHWSRWEHVFCEGDYLKSNSLSAIMLHCSWTRTSINSLWDQLLWQVRMIIYIYIYYTTPDIPPWRRQLCYDVTVIWLCCTSTCPNACSGKSLESKIAMLTEVPAWRSWDLSLYIYIYGGVWNRI